MTESVLWSWEATPPFKPCLQVCVLRCSKPCVDTVLKPGLLAFPQFELQVPEVTSLLVQETLCPHTRVLDGNAEKSFMHLNLYYSEREGITYCQAKYSHYFWITY